VYSSASLEKLLLDAGVLDDEGLARARQTQLDQGGTLTAALEQLKLVEPVALAGAVAEYMGLPFDEKVDISAITSELTEAVPIHFARRNRIVPLRRTENGVEVALSNDEGLAALGDLQVIYGCPVTARVSPADEVEAAINRVYELASSSAEQMMEDFDAEGLDALAHSLDEPRDLLDADDEAPVIRLVNTILFQAAKDRASDVHIEPFERELVVRYRIDGLLYKVLTPPKSLQAPIVSRVKVMAGLDIAEKRLPQDGRIRIKLAGKDIDIRVSVLPTAFGERVVMRLLDKSAVVLKLEELGLGGTRLEQFKRLIKRPHGILLVTGPTGSGKTTTLYSGLTRINSEDVNIITVEDPIEYQIMGIGQIQVNPKIDLTFAAGLRSILRQDPDVIMVGEIRDVETAEIAIQASLTGHLVFSTLHTNDAASAVTRLVEMGVEQFLVASSVIAIIAQRLVRVLCPNCKTPYEPTNSELAELALTRGQLTGGVLYHAVGCEECRQTGYRGRLGIYELLHVDDKIRHQVMAGSDASQIKRVAVEGGMLTLRHDGAAKAARGVTTAEEVIRVTQEEA
jgi:general secretion pathway protein E